MEWPKLRLPWNLETFQPLSDCVALLTVKRWCVMLPCVRPGFAAALLAVLTILCANRGHGQTFNLENDRVQMAEFRGMLRFHTGDDPDGKLGWVDPGFDDSSWQLLRSDTPWNLQGYAGYGGMAWYRLQVILPAKHPPLALHIPGFQTSYQVFADGRLIGQWGGLPPHEKVLFGFAEGQIVSLPSDIASRGGPLTIAIRVWHWPHWSMIYGGGPSSPIRIGDAGLLSEWMTLRTRDAFWSVSARSILLLGYLLAGFAGLGLFLLRPVEREYLWFAATEFLSAAFFAWDVYAAFHPAGFWTYLTLVACLQDASGICLLVFIVALLKERKATLYWLAIATLAIHIVMLIPGELEWLSLPKWDALGIINWMPFEVCVLLILFFAARRGNLDARLLLGPVGLSYGVALVNGVLFQMSLTGHNGLEMYRLRSDLLFTWPFPISAQNVADFLMQISILAILVLRFARTRRNEERNAAELEAARVVQQVLVPNEIPTIPGFEIQSVYRPAGQVGGDFFQILPVDGGGVLVVIGDVSGKGMPAAMTVSLLVGTIRTLAHYTQSPGNILAAMNQRMLARSSGGFTTCLVLRCDADGKLTLANAGHIAPYVEGKELQLENGLPLGLASDTTYAECSLQLMPGQQLTLLTDGVVEARDKTGSLLSFERSAALSIQSAEAIARAAQAFGQDDDITVLTLSYAGVPASA